MGLWGTLQSQHLWVFFPLGWLDFSEKGFSSATSSFWRFWGVMWVESQPARRWLPHRLLGLWLPSVGVTSSPPSAAVSSAELPLSPFPQSLSLRVRSFLKFRWDLERK